MFDDVSSTDYTGCEYMVTKGISGTLYPVSDFIGVEGYMSAAQLTTLQTAGFAIGNHTVHHVNLTTQSQEDQETALSSCKTALDAAGFTAASDCVAYPFGAYNADTLLAMAATGMRCGRGPSGYSFLPSVFPAYEMPWYDVTYTTELATVQGWITGAVTLGACICIVFHKLVASDAGVYEWLQSDFEALIDWVVAQGITTKTILDVAP